MFIDLPESDTQYKPPTWGRMYQKQHESKRKVLWEKTKNIIWHVHAWKIKTEAEANTDSCALHAVDITEGWSSKEQLQTFDVRP